MSGSPAWGSGIRGRSPQSIWLWRPAGLDCRSSTGLGEAETPFLEDAHNVLHVPGPRAKAVTSQEPRPDLPASLGGCPGEAGCGHGSPWGSGDSEECSSTWTLEEADVLLGSSAPRPGPTQQPVGSSPGRPQAKQLTGWEHSPTHQQTGCLKTSWAHSRL